LRLQDGALLIVATGKADENAIESYARRWQIETLFSCLKSRGFNFEDTHVTDRRRIKRLLVVAVIAFCWAHRAVNGSMNRLTLSKSKNISGLPKAFSGLGLRINEALFKFAYSSENALKLVVCNREQSVQFLDTMVYLVQISSIFVCFPILNIIICQILI
jgi:hypothetical protein